MHFGHISAKITLKILKQHFDSGGPSPLSPPSGYALVWPQDGNNLISLNSRCISNQLAIY